MTTREKRLTAIVAAAGALWAGSKGLTAYRAALAAGDDAQITAISELEEARTAASRGHRARRKLSQWRRESLPTDADVAESLYRDWLSGELKAAGLNSPQVSERARAVAGEQATELTFTVTAEGELSQWLEFFRRFAAAPHLHRISETNLVPDDKRKKITGTLRVDALSLADCDRDKQLAATAGEGDPAIAESATHLIAAVTDRKPFEPHSDKPPERKREDNGADGATISAMFSGLKGWIVTVRQTKSGDTDRFIAGDTMKFGSFEAKIVLIDGRRVVYETPEGRFEVRLGQTLSEAQPLTLPEA